MFCRIVHQDLNGYYEEKPKEESVVLKNSKNKILHFLFINGEVEFQYDFLSIKKIPKNEAEIFDRQDVHLINFANKKSFIIQSFTPVNVLVQSEKTNSLEKKMIDDIIPGDSVAFYHNVTNDIYLVEVISNNMIGDYRDTIIKEEGEEEESEYFNNYIIGSDNFYKGLVINDLLIL